MFHLRIENVLIPGAYTLFPTDRPLKWILLIAFVTLATYPVRAQFSILTIEQLGELAPEKIEGYRLVERLKGRSIKIGTLSYSMMERTFVQGKKEINVMLFDYNNASVMFRQASQRWKNVEGHETDLMLENTYELEKQPGWMQYDKANNKAQIALGIQNRFYLLLNGVGIPFNDLDNIAKIFDIARFPQLEMVINDAKHR